MQNKDYALALHRQQFRIAAENPAKMPVVMDLLRHEISQTNGRVLIIGEFNNDRSDALFCNLNPSL
jgi:hypothetical protein